MSDLASINLIIRTDASFWLIISYWIHCLSFYQLCGFTSLISYVSYRDHRLFLQDWNHNCQQLYPKDFPFVLHLASHWITFHVLNCFVCVVKSDPVVLFASFESLHTLLSSYSAYLNLLGPSYREELLSFIVVLRELWPLRLFLPQSNHLLHFALVDSLPYPCLVRIVIAILGIRHYPFRPQLA